jgi:hypothetical protein
MGQFRLLSKNTKITIYKNSTLPAVLYGCETGSLTLMEKRGLMVFENRVLKGLFGLKTDNRAGG